MCSAAIAPYKCSNITQAGADAATEACDFQDAAKISARLKIPGLRPFQVRALKLLQSAEIVDTKFIQAPTGVGKDLLPFAMAVITDKVQLVFVPFVALIATVEKEGRKFGCNVIRFSDIHKKVSLETAAATAHVIVLSYEHCGKAIRLVQELLSRHKLGNFLYTLKRVTLPVIDIVHQH